MVGRWARALLVAALVALAVAVDPRPAAAATDHLDVELTSVSTPTLDLSNPAQVVQLSGTLTNVSTVPIRYVNVHFWRLSTPQRTTAQLAQTMVDVPVGARLFDEQAGNLDTLTRDEDFAPGQRAAFTVRATVAQLTSGQFALSETDVGYLLGVQVRGIPADGPNQVVGADQVVVAATTGPVDSAALVLLSAPPTWLPDGTFIDDALARDLAGRLETLLAAAERDGVVAAVDPALLEAVEVMTGDHVVGGVSTPGSGVAVGWLRRVEALAEQERLWRLPFGNPHLARAEAAGELPRVLEWAASATPASMLALPSVAVLEEGAGEGLARQLTALDTVVVRNASGSRAGAPLLVGASPLAGFAALPPGVRLGSLITAELLADEAPLYVISTVEAAEANNTPGALRRHVAPGSTPGGPLVWPEATEPAPWPALADRLRAVEAAAEFLGRLMASDEPTDLSRIGSTAFSKDFADEAAAVAYLDAVAPSRVDASLVTLRAAESFVMGSRTNTFPVTVTNGLGVPIQVRIQFASDSPQRIRVPAVGPVTVAPGQAATVDITPEATANGVAIVRAQLTTVAGDPLGRPLVIEITATDFGRVGWIIIVVSGAVVVGGTALRIRAVQRERSGKENSEPSQ